MTAWVIRLNMNYAAIEALNNWSYMRRNVHRVIEQRERVLRKPDKLRGHAYSSRTNFLFTKTGVPDIPRRFRDMGVLVLDLSNRLSPGFMRVSVGTREENDVFLDSYTKILEDEDSKRMFPASYAYLSSKLRRKVQNDNERRKFVAA